MTQPSQISFFTDGGGDGCHRGWEGRRAVVWCCSQRTGVAACSALYYDSSLVLP